MRHVDYDELIDALLPLVREAGEAIMRVYRESGEVHYKDDHSPVTSADLVAHRLLVQDLAHLLPDCPVVSEEDEHSRAYRRANGRFWLIDPLDGTKEFVARNGEFTVNVALIEEGRSLLGVVYAPAMDVLYWGGQGLGAFRGQGREPPLAIQVGEGKEGRVCRVVASTSHLNAETQAFIDRLGAVSLLQAGISLKFCRVAEGLADLYPRLGPTCEWDTAAAQAVLEGAGGVVVDMAGQPLRYGKPDILNPSFVATRDACLISA